jgi:uncharacterized protein (TIGR00290 family)
MAKRVLLFWSSGKDSAWTLYTLRQEPDVEVVALVTTFNTAFDRVAMHSTRRNLARAQAARTGLPLWEVELPWPCSNDQYEAITRPVFARAGAEGISSVAFGDLFLEDVRQYRVRQLEGTRLEPLFPIWGKPTEPLAREMIEAGVRAKIVCVNPKILGREFAGREYDERFLDDLPPEVDRCGERGEFHTFVYDAPVFAKPLPVQTGKVVERDGFIFADIIYNK